jgi:hypothetical protein
MNLARECNFEVFSKKIIFIELLRSIGEIRMKDKVSLNNLI